MAASLKNLEGPGVSFRCGGEGLEVKRLLAGGPGVVNPADNVLAQGEKTLVQCGHCVRRLEKQVKLRNLGSGPVHKRQILCPSSDARSSSSAGSTRRSRSVGSGSRQRQESESSRALVSRGCWQDRKRHIPAKTSLKSKNGTDYK